MSVPDTYAMALGSNWRHVYDRYLHIINPAAIYGVTAEREDGKYISFSSSSGIYTTDSDLDYGLTRSGSTWTLTAPDDTIETYTASGAEALLQTIKRRNGYTLTMHYTGSKLTSITDSYSRALGLSYSSVGLLANVTTPDTLALSYGYVNFSSGGHLLSTVGYNTTPATHQTYLYENTSYPSALTGIIDENNHRYATWTYDAKGRGATSQLANGVNFTSVTYFDATGNRAVTGPLGITETYKFTTLQGVPKVTEIDRAANGTVATATRLFAYDANGYLKSATDWNGNTTAYTNNVRGQPTQVVYASGATVSHTTNLAYDTTWVHLIKTMTTPGLTTTNNYDAATGNLLTRVLTDTTTTAIPYSTNGQARTWTYTYTPTGQVQTVQLPRADVVAKTTFGYGASPNAGTLTSVTDALSHVTTVNTYKPGGLPLTVTDPNGVLTTLGYSTRLWPTSSALTTSSGVLTTGLQYDSAGNLTRDTLPDGSYLAYGYDNAHRLTSIANRLGETQGLSYNSAGNLTQTLWKNASAVTKRQHNATFDALGRMATDVGGMGQATTFGYDNNGNPTTVKDPLLHVATQTFDALDRLKTSRNAVLDLSQLSYDAHDRPLTVTDGKGNVTSYVYDGFGEVIQETSPDRGTTVWRYDADGNVSSKTDAASAVTNYTYDALDRMLTRAYPADSTLNVTLAYDQAGHGKGVGRLTSVTDQPGSLSLSYDERGLVTSNARTIAGTAYTTGYTYESAGRLASVTYPVAGWKVAYTRDNAGQISSITDKPPSAAAVTIATSVTHLPFGPVASLTYGNGVTGTRTYDLDYRTTNITDTGASAVQNLTYGYDAGNNVRTITDAVTPANNQTLTYDAIDRLKSAVGSYGTVSAITYDSNSNMLTYGATNFTVPATSNRVSTAAGSAVAYTATGNVNAIAGSAFTYNKANQLASIATGNSLYYDFLGWRLKAVTSGPSTYIDAYTPSGGLMAAIANGAEYDYVYLDDTLPVAAVKPSTSTVSAIHTNNLGTPQKLTSAAKAIVWGLAMQPYGNGTANPSTVQQDLRFPGQAVESGGYFFNLYRDYNPGWGRYLQADPIGIAGGLNPYVYAENNPYKYTDSMGLCPTATAPDCIDKSYPFESALALWVGGTGAYNAFNAIVATNNLGRLNNSSVPGSPQTAPSEPSGAQCTVATPEDIIAPEGNLIGIPGNGPDVRLLPGGQNEAESLFNQLSQGRTSYTGNYPGTGYSLPNGGFVGYRPVSRSGPPTVDVNTGEGGINVRFHFIQN